MSQDLGCVGCAEMSHDSLTHVHPLPERSGGSTHRKIDMVEEDEAPEESEKPSEPQARRPR